MEVAETWLYYLLLVPASLIASIFFVFLAWLGFQMFINN